jgi:hypothetical protein
MSPFCVKQALARCGTILQQAGLTMQAAMIENASSNNV